MLAEIQTSQRLHPFPSLVTFSKVKHQKDEKLRNQMTDALILSLQGHHFRANELFQAALKEAA